MVKFKNLLIILCFITGFSILLQWIMVWVGLFRIENTVPGYSAYFKSFAIADIWLIANAFLAGGFLLARNEKALFFGIALGSAMLFFGLYALLYDINTGLFYIMTPDEIFGRIVTFLNILGGIFFMFGFWQLRILHKKPEQVK